MKINLRVMMKENFRKKPEEVTEETSHEKDLTKHITEDFEIERETEYATNNSFLEVEYPEVKFIKVNNPGKFILGQKHQLTKSLDMEGDTKKTFSCNLCDKVVQSKSGLKYHMITHSEENTYICSQCNLSYITASDHKQHMNTHTGEKNITVNNVLTPAVERIISVDTWRHILEKRNITVNCALTPAVKWVISVDTW